MAKKESYKVSQCCFLNDPNYGKYILKCSGRDIVKYDAEPTEEQINIAIQEWKVNAMNHILDVFERVGEEKISVKVSDITEFGITNQKMWTNKGTFKSWWKRFYIRVNNGMHYWIYESDFHVLKELLDGKFTKEKYTKEEYKSYSERKATDWTYKVIA